MFKILVVGVPVSTLTSSPVKLAVVGVVLEELLDSSESSVVVGSSLLDGFSLEVVSLERVLEELVVISSSSSTGSETTGVVLVGVVLVGVVLSFFISSADSNLPLGFTSRFSWFTKPCKPSSSLFFSAISRLPLLLGSALNTKEFPAR